MKKTEPKVFNQTMKKILLIPFLWAMKTNLIKWRHGARVGILKREAQEPELDVVGGGWDLGVMGNEKKRLIKILRMSVLRIIKVFKLLRFIMNYDV